MIGNIIGSIIILAIVFWLMRWCGIRTVAAFRSVFKR